MRIALSIIFAASTLAASVAQAADRKIDEFVGRWIGTGQATQGGVNPVTTQSRDSEVIVEKTADGFKLSWTTMSSDVGNASQSKVKASALTFRKTKQAGVFVDVKSGHALDGKKTTWARLSGDTLTVNQLVVAEDGQWDLTVYDRTLKDKDHMALSFTRLANGEMVRQAKLSMTRSRD